jgi:hypothetical protein
MGVLLQYLGSVIVSTVNCDSLGCAMVWGFEFPPGMYFLPVL